MSNVVPQAESAIDGTSAAPAAGGLLPQQRVFTVAAWVVIVAGTVVALGAAFGVGVVVGSSGGSGLGDEPYQVVDGPEGPVMMPLNPLELLPTPMMPSGEAPTAVPAPPR